MREILFRGQKANNEWVYGNLTMIGEFPYISEAMGHENSVFKETVGQYTGLTDKNGTKIFEGDIIQRKYEFNGVVNHIETYKIVFWDGGFSYAIENDDFPNYICDTEYAICIDEFEVIGNIYDNPKMLKGE